jgi:hypothetical protein
MWWCRGLVLHPPVMLHTPTARRCTGGTLRTSAVVHHIQSHGLCRRCDYRHGHDTSGYAALLHQHHDCCVSMHVGFLEGPRSSVRRNMVTHDSRSASVCPGSGPGCRDASRLDLPRNQSAFIAFASVGVIALSAGYSIPITLSLFFGRQEVSQARWTLGPVLGTAANVVAVVWILFELVLFGMPTVLPTKAASANYAPAVFVGLSALSGVWYAISGKDRKS